MMMGTDERDRMARHTSIPDSFGQHDVEQHEVGTFSSNSSSASVPSRAMVTSKPSRPSPSDSASMNDSSSSATSTLMRRSSASLLVSAAACPVVRPVVERASARAGFVHAAPVGRGFIRFRSGWT